MFGRVVLVAALLTTKITSDVPSTHLGARADNLSIGGTIWEDANIDGMRQPSEKGIRIINVSLFQGFVERSRVQPDDDGHYVFSGLDPGVYTVRLTQAPAVFFWTFPARKGVGPFETGVNLTTASVSDVDFGLKTLEFSRFTVQGRAWLDAQAAAKPDVRAIIDGIDCTGGTGGELFSDLVPSNTFDLTVLSSAYVSGCGEDGKLVQFTLNGLPARASANQVTEEPLIWKRGEQRFFRNVIIGPPFSTFEVFPVGVDYTGDNVADPMPGTLIEAFVADVPCGQVTMQARPTEYLSVVSSSLRPGCAVAGSPIEFKINGVNVTSLRTSGLDGLHQGASEPWLSGVRGVDLILRAPDSPIRPPNTGDGGVQSAR